MQVSSTTFWVFGMTRPEIELRSSGQTLFHKANGTIRLYKTKIMLLITFLLLIYFKGI